jgi:four helix bundle protein
MAWKIFQKLPKTYQYNIGSQFLESADSVQANIAEAYGRFHFKDKMKFHFNARGSLLESISWCEILQERNLLTPTLKDEFITLSNRTSMVNNAYMRYLWRELQKTSK